MAQWVKNLAAMLGDTGDTGSIPGSGRSSRGRNSNLLQCSCLKNVMDRGAWWAIVHGMTKSQTWLITSTHKDSHTLKTTNHRTAQSWQLTAYRGKEYQITLHVFWETCMQVKKQQLQLDMEQLTGSKLGKSMTRLYTVTLLIQLLCRVNLVKGQVGLITSWNQDCQQKHQQPRICRW